MKKHGRLNAKLNASRFIVVFLSIIAQVLAVIALFFILGRRFALIAYAMSAIGFLLLIFIMDRQISAVYKLPWMFLFLTFPVAGVIIYFTFGNVRVGKKQMKKYRAVFSEAKEDYKQEEVFSRLEKSGSKGVGAIKYIANATSMPVFDNSLCEYLPSGEIYFAKMLEELKKAEEYIFIEYFVLENGYMWDEIHKIILDKMKCGVKAYVMYDDVGSMKSVRASYYKKLKKEGIFAKKFHKFVPVVSVSHNNRDHRKICVVDGKVAFTGGVNLSDEYINVTHPLGRWIDTGVIIRGQAVDSLIKMFIQNYNMAGGIELDEKDFVKTSHEEYSDGFIMPYGDAPAPIMSEHVGENVYLDIINRSDRYLYITTPYLIVDTNILTALKTAVRRGVDVRIIIPTIPDKKLIYILTKSMSHELLLSGVKIYRYKDGFMHSKTFLSDDEVATVGSVNLDYRSFLHHFENGVIMTGNSAINDIYADFMRLFDNECTEATEKEIRLRWYERVIKVFLNLLAPLF